MNAIRRRTTWSRITRFGLVPFGMALSLSGNAVEETDDLGDVDGATYFHELDLTGKGVSIGVVDLGFDPSHPATPGSSFVPLVNRFTDTAGNKYVLDASDLVVDRSGRVNVHGLAVSSVLGEPANDAKVFQVLVALTVRTLEPSLLSALGTLRRDAPDVRIINLSFNIPPTGDDLQAVEGDAFKWNSIVRSISQSLLKQARGDRLIVFAAGNEQRQQPGLLSVLPRFQRSLEKHFLNVVALDDDGTLASYSNHCGVSKDWCLAAPGSLVVATSTLTPEGELRHGGIGADGTSFAAPVVSASAALLAERFPYMNMEQIRMTLLTTATDKGDADRYGWGVLNILKAVSGPAQLLGDQRVFMDSTLGGRNASDFWRNDIVAGGRLTKAGSGSLGLLGDNRFAGVRVEQGELLLAGRNTLEGASNVEGGRLQVQGSLQGTHLHVARTGRLAGNGRIHVPTRVDGTLEVGALGSPAFTRTVEFTRQSTTLVDVSEARTVRLEGPRAHARLGGSVQLTGGAGQANTGHQWLLSSAGGATFEGGFESLRQVPGLATHGLRQDLRFVEQGILLSTAPVTLPTQSRLSGNAREAAQALNALRDRPIALRPGAYNAWLHASLNRNDLGNLEKSAGGQVYADGRSYLSRQPAELDRAMFRELGKPLAHQDARVWYSALSADQDNGERQGISASQERTKGQVLGVVHAAGEKTRAAASLARTEGKVSSAGGSLRLDITQVGLGIHHAFDHLESGAYASANISAGHVAGNGKRRLSGFATAKSDSHGSLYSTALRTGYRWSKAGWQLEPHAGVSAVHVRSGSVHERQSELALDVKGQRQDAVFGTAGVRATRAVRLGDWLFEPELELTHVRTLGGISSHADATLQGVGLKQHSANAARDRLAFGLALAASQGPVKGAFELRGAKGDRTSGNGVNVKLSYDF